MPKAETTPVLSDEFRDFLVEAKQQGYTPHAAVQPTPTGGEVMGYTHPDGTYRYIDRYEGGYPFTGHEVVSVHDDEEGYMPVWGMAYFQTLAGGSTRAVSEVLHAVLPQPDMDYLPIRGPRNWQDGDARYSLRKVTSDSTLEQFDAEEMIWLDGHKVYIARFMGGLINQQSVEIDDARWLKQDG